MIGRLINILVFTVIAFSWAVEYTGHIITTTASIGLTIFFLVFLRTKGHCRFPKYFILPWLYIAYDSVSVLWAPDFAWALGSMLQIQSAALLGTSLWFSMNNGTSPRVVVAGFAAGAAMGIASAIPEVIRYGFGIRVAGFFGNPNSFAMFCSYAAFAILFGLSKPPKGASWIAGVFILFPFLFSGSRKMFLVIIVLATASLWTTFLHPIPKTRRRILIFLILATMGGSHFVLEHLDQLQIYKRGLELVKGKSHSEDRHDLIITGWELWKQSPVFGYGSGQFTPVTRMPYYSHNSYIELLVNDGLVGLGLFHALVGVAIYRAKQKMRFPAASYPGSLWSLLLILCVNFAMVVLGGFTSWIFMCFASHLALHRTIVSTPEQPPNILIAKRYRHVGIFK